MLERSLAILVAAAGVPLAGGCHGNPPPPMNGADMTPVGDPDSRAVDAPACVGNWLISSVPRGGGTTRYALGADGAWQMIYEGPITFDFMLGVRHVSETTITEADTAPLAASPTGQQGMALTPDGTVEAFAEVSGSGIAGARLVNGTWHTIKPFGTYNSASVVVARSDGAGHAHVGFTAGYLYHATDASGSFVVEEVAPQKGALLSTEVVDSSDHVHLFYEDEHAAWFWATNASGSWQVVALPSPFVGTAAVDHSGQPHVFSADPQGVAHHLTYLAGAWNDEALPATVPTVSSAVFDAADQLRVVGVDPSGNLVYATKSNGTWTPTTVLNVGGTGRAIPTLALDAAGKPHIAFDSFAVLGDQALHRFARPCQ